MDINDSNNSQAEKNYKKEIKENKLKLLKGQIKELDLPFWKKGQFIITVLTVFAGVIAIIINFNEKFSQLEKDSRELELYRSNVMNESLDNEDEKRKTDYQKKETLKLEIEALLRAQTAENDVKHYLNNELILINKTSQKEKQIEVAQLKLDSVNFALKQLINKQETLIIDDAISLLKYKVEGNIQELIKYLIKEINSNEAQREYIIERLYGLHDESADRYKKIKLNTYRFLNSSAPTAQLNAGRKIAEPLEVQYFINYILFHSSIANQNTQAFLESNIFDLLHENDSLCLGLNANVGNLLFESDKLFLNDRFVNILESYMYEKKSRGRKLGDAMYILLNWYKQMNISYADRKYFEISKIGILSLYNDTCYNSFILTNIMSILPQAYCAMEINYLYMHYCDYEYDPFYYKAIIENLNFSRNSESHLNSNMDNPIIQFKEKHDLVPKLGNCSGYSTIFDRNKEVIAKWLYIDTLDYDIDSIQNKMLNFEW